MAARNKCIESVHASTVEEVISYFKTHQSEYKTVLKQLIVQVRRTDLL